MEFEALRFFICFAGCAVATYYDLFNRRNVPTWLSYSLVGMGVIFTFATFNPSLIFYNLSVGFVVFVIGYLLYITGQIGGADVLLFVSIALLLPEAPHPLLTPTYFNSGFPFVVSVFMLSGMLGVFGVFLKYVPVTLYNYVKGEKLLINRTTALLSAITLILYMALLYTLTSIVELSQLQLAVFTAVIICATFTFALKEHIAEKYMIKMVGVDEIDEEDILAVEKMDEEFVKRHNLRKLLTLSEIEKLKKIGKRKKFPVYKEMPVFMPYVLIALLFSVLFGDPLGYLLPILFE
ncbi:MAG: A24 family peptidase [Candidatus Micrarchaeia archaeon]